jgi:glycogen debranching enzyme
VLDSYHRELVARLRDVLGERLIGVYASGSFALLYPEATARIPTGEAGFLLNLNTGPGMDFRADEAPGAIERHWFTLDRAIARSVAVAFAGPPPEEVVREALEWYQEPGRAGDGAATARRSTERRWQPFWNALSWSCRPPVRRFLATFPAKSLPRAVNAEDLIIIDGCTFFYSCANGDVEAGNSQGLFYRDVRHVSRWLLRLNDEQLDPLTSRRVDYYSARVVNKPHQAGGDRPNITVRRDRFVSEGVHEDVVLENLTEEPQDVRLELDYGADFADVMEAEASGNGKGRHWQETSTRSVSLWNERDGYRRGTLLTFSRNGQVAKERATFRVELQPREVWSLCIDITPIVDGKRWPPLLRCDGFHEHPGKMPMSLDEWLEDSPRLHTENPALERTYRQSLLDIAALRVRPDDVTIRWAMPGGGVPWFMTVFGRDSLVTAYATMPYHQELAQATLEALAELQATEWDNWRDAEPGKISHELRRGTLAATGQIPHTPYYGAHDSTPLWLIVLDEYERWTGDVSFVRRVEPHLRAALSWLEGPADLDGDGYIEYRKRSTSDKALDNHCWRDSHDSIRFADGTQAVPPIATAEHQGLAYQARLRTARLLRDVFDDEGQADRLEEEAASLKERFNKDFWSSARRHYVLALDGDKRQVDSMTSDVGHLLWSGIVDDARAGPSVKRLIRDDMFSGWGVRSMSAGDNGYNPLAYHCGTVWPHDTALVAEGMRRYGFREDAARLCNGLLDAAEAFSNQLPEVFAGFARDETGVPVEYPEALKPQSWAAAAPLLALRTLLGLDPVDGELTWEPHLPEDWQTLTLTHIGFRGRYVDLT